MQEKATENETAENEITETETAETETAETETTETETAENRGYFLKVVAGIYLIYTAYELADSYLKNEEGSSLGFCVAGIIFGLIGVFLLYIVVRDYLRDNKQKDTEPAIEAKTSKTETGTPAAEAKAFGTKGKNSGERAQNVDNPRQM